MKTCCDYTACHGDVLTGLSENLLWLHRLSCDVLTGLGEGLDGDVRRLEYLVAKVQDVAEDVEVGVARGCEVGGDDHTGIRVQIIKEVKHHGHHLGGQEGKASPVAVHELGLVNVSVCTMEQSHTQSYCMVWFLSARWNSHTHRVTT